MKTIIVAGCTRSGMTMMMNVLYTGGYPCLGHPPGFEDYYQPGMSYEQLKGYAVKVVDTHNWFPPKGDYLVIRMDRNKDEQAKSIMKFIKHVLRLPIQRSQKAKVKASLLDDLKKIDQWASKQTKCITVSFESLILNPKQTIGKISNEIGFRLSEKAIKAIIPRGTKCYNGMLEIKLIEDAE